MTIKTEVEYIGKISKSKFEELNALFSKKGTFKKQKTRLSLMYFRDKIPLDIEEIKDELVDLRYRITNKEHEIVLKYGSFSGSHARKEVSLVFPSEESEKYIEFLKLLGWHLGVIYASSTSVYEYEDVEFSLVEIKDYGYNFEAEILSDEDKIEDAKMKLEKELKNLGLSFFSKEDLDKQCNMINNKEDLQFDFDKMNFIEIKNRFKEFF